MQVVVVEFFFIIRQAKLVKNKFSLAQVFTALSMMTIFQTIMMNQDLQLVVLMKVQRSEPSQGEEMIG